MHTEGGIWIDKRLLVFIFGIGAIVFLINTYLYQVCIIHGNSMDPTLKNKDIVIIKKYNLELNYNDIVVIKKNNKIIIKRLIALPNDLIKIKNYVYVNDKKIDDLYTEDSGIIKNEIALGSNQYFILGDNRQNSIDSRYEEIGMISREEIIGKIISNKY